MIYFNNSFVSWKNKKHSIVSRSSIESEYMALGFNTCEIIWILNFLFELGIKDLTIVPVFCDNDSTIKLTLNLIFHERTKHFEIDLHFVREKVSNCDVKMVQISSCDQILIF